MFVPRSSLVHLCLDLSLGLGLFMSYLGDLFFTFNFTFIAIVIFILLSFFVCRCHYPSFCGVMFIKLDFEEPFFSLIFSVNFSHIKVASTLYETTMRKSLKCFKCIYIYRKFRKFSHFYICIVKMKNFYNMLYQLQWIIWFFKMWFSFLYVAELNCFTCF